MKLLSAILLFFLFQPIQAQKLLKEYVKNNTIPIFTIQPDSTNYSDLKGFGDVIGDARIVLLGEQEHGDAAAFLAKSRLIKYLHEEKGFNVLAFESDFFGLTEGWDQLEKTKAAIDSFMYYNPFPIWSECNTCSSLFYHYIADTYKMGNPLHIAGFDCQLHSRYTIENYKVRLKEILKKIESSRPEYKTRIETTLLSADSLILSKENTHNRDTFSVNTSIQFLTTVLAGASSDLLSSFEIQVLKNLLAELNNTKTRNGATTPVHYFRDKQMAENIEWLFQTKYPGKKIIVWAHNAHIAKNFGLSNSPLNDYSMMGNYLSKSAVIKDKIYVVGFTSYTGYTSWTTTNRFDHKVQKPAKDGFENWIAKDNPYAFTDFRQFNVKYPDAKPNFSMKGSINPNNQHGNYVTDWTKVFDGVFFIREMYGCK